MPRVYHAQAQPLVATTESPEGNRRKKKVEGAGSVRNATSTQREKIPGHEGKHNMTELLDALDRQKSPQPAKRSKSKMDAADERPSTRIRTGNRRTQRDDRSLNMIDYISSTNHGSIKWDSGIGIENIAASVQVALKNHLEMNGPAYECSFEELCKHVCSWMRVQYCEKSENEMPNMADHMRFCLRVMIGVGLIRSTGDVVVVLKV